MAPAVLWRIVSIDFCVCLSLYGEKVFLNIPEQEIPGRAQYFLSEGCVYVHFSSATNRLLRQ